MCDTDYFCLFDGSEDRFSKDCDTLCRTQPNCAKFEQTTPINFFPKRCKNVNLHYSGHGQNQEFLRKHLREWVQRYKGGTVTYYRDSCAEGPLSQQEEWGTFLKSLDGQGIFTCQQAAVGKRSCITPVTFSFGQGVCNIRYHICRAGPNEGRCYESDLGRQIKCLKSAGDKKPIAMTCCLSQSGQPRFIDGDRCPIVDCDRVDGLECQGGPFTERMPYSIDCGPLQDEHGKPWKGMCCKSPKGKYDVNRENYDPKVGFQKVCCADWFGYHATESNGLKYRVYGDREPSCKQFPETGCSFKVTADKNKPDLVTASLKIVLPKQGLPITSAKPRITVPSIAVTWSDAKNNGTLFEIADKDSTALSYTRSVSHPKESSAKSLLFFGHARVCYFYMEGNYLRCENVFCKENFEDASHGVGTQDGLKEMNELLQTFHSKIRDHSVKKKDEATH